MSSAQVTASPVAGVANAPAPAQALPRSPSLSASQPAPVANPIGAGSVAVLHSPAAELEIKGLFDRLDSIGLSAAPLADRKVTKFRLQETSAPVHNLWTVEGIATFSVEEVVRAVRAVINLFKYYAMTWGDNAKLVDTVIARIQSETFDLDLEGDANWVNQLEIIEQNKDMIAYFLGDNKARAFTAFLDLIRARMIAADGSVKELEMAGFKQELEILDRIIKNPAGVDLKALERNEQFGTADQQHAKVAQTLRDGFMLLQSTLNSRSVERFDADLVYSTLMLMSRDAKAGGAKFPAGAELAAQLRDSLSMNDEQLLKAVDAKRSELNAKFGRGNTDQLVAALDANIREAERVAAAARAAAEAEAAAKVAAEEAAAEQAAADKAAHSRVVLESLAGAGMLPASAVPAPAAAAADAADAAGDDAVEVTVSVAEPDEVR